MRDLPFVLIISQKSLRELEATPDAVKRRTLVSYGSQLLRWSLEAFSPAQPTDADRGLGAGIQRFLAALPNEMDRQLVGEAIMQSCDVFLTLDRKTIRNRAEEVDLVARWTALRIMRPTEVWDRFRPWARLYS